MHITKIKGVNIMGRSFENELGRLTAIIGPNDTGKTARMNCIKLCFADSLVDQRGKQIKPKELASGPMEVQVEVNTGETVHRKWDKKGSIDLHMNMIGLFPPVLLDSRVYFQLSPKQRTDHVFELFSEDVGDDFKPSSITSKVAGLKPEEPSEEYEASLARVLVALRSIEAKASTGWLSAATATVDTDLSTAKANATRMAQTIQGLTQLNEQYASEPVNVPELEAELAGIQQELTTLNQQLGSINSKVGEFHRAQLKVRTLNDQLSRLTPIDNAQATKLQDAIVEAEKLASAYVDHTRETQDAVNAAAEALAGPAKEQFALRQQLGAITAKLAEAKSKGYCPYCGGSNDFAAFIENMEDDKEQLEHELAQISVKVTGLNEVLADTRTTAIIAQRAAESHRQLQAQITQLRGENDVLLARARQIADLTVQRDAIAIPQVDDSALLRIEGEIAGKQQLANTIQDTLKKAGATANHRQRVAQAQLEKANADADVEVLTAVQKLLKETKAQMVQKVFDRLLVPCNELIGQLTKPIDFRDGEIGHVNNGQWVPHDLFCGFGQALTYAALSVVLARGAPIKLLLFDECTRLSFDNKRKLAVALAGLLDQSKLDQCVIVDTDSAAYENVHGMTIVRTE